MPDVEYYRDIYGELEKTILQNIESPEGFDDRMGRFLEQYGPGRLLSDDDYYWTMVYVAFYSGMNAEIVTHRRATIRSYLSRYQRAASYDDRMIHRMMTDPRMIGHERKIKASIQNAKEVARLVRRYGSFRAYVESFGSMESMENILRFRNDLVGRFSYLGPITSYHFMMDIGLPVLKPDRVVIRVLERLALVPKGLSDEETMLETIRQGKLISEASGKVLRQVDIMLVSFGQVGGNSDLGLMEGICLKDEPRCTICNLKGRCIFYMNHMSGT